MRSDQPPATCYPSEGNSSEQEQLIIDDRTMHELYAHPLLLIVMAGVASVMCSYSKRETLALAICDADANTDLVNGT